MKLIKYEFFFIVYSVNGGLELLFSPSGEEIYSGIQSRAVYKNHPFIPC
jgi:hypothetical protein